MKNNGEDKYSSCFQEAYLERKAIEVKISQCTKLLEQEKIKYLEKLVEILVDRRPLNVIFKEF